MVLRLALGLLAVASAFGASVASGADEPPEITGSEVAAVELAVSYLASGPEAWRGSPALADADDSSRAAWAAGPPEGAVWRLLAPSAGDSSRSSFWIRHPSGLEEVLTLELEPAPPHRLLKVEAASASSGRSSTRAAPSTEGEPGSPAATPDPSSRWVLGLLAASITLFLLSFLDRRARPFFLVPATLAAAGALALHLGWGPFSEPVQEARPSAKGKARTTETPDRALADLKAALALGDVDAERQALARVADPDGFPAVTWRVQAALEASDLSTAERLLERARAQGRSVMVDLLAGRLGAERLDVTDASSAYERLLESGARFDPWLLEASEAFALFELERSGREARERLESLGSRHAEVYYHLARFALVEGLRGKAARFFERAWALEPLSRRQLLEDYLLAYLTLSSPELRRGVDFGSFHDRPVPCDAKAPRILDLPDVASALHVGGLLVVTVGDARLEVPGGCALAPPGSPATGADAYRRALDRELLEALPELGPESSAVAVARARKALAPLVREHRWETVIEVAEAVEALDRSAGRAPDPEVLGAHAEALERLGRRAGAAAQLIRVARLNRDQQRADPSTLLRLSEILVEEQEYDRALRMIKTALDRIPFETSGLRLLQVEMEERLFRSSKEHLSDHFRIVYPPSRTFLFAQKAARILEDERRRLAPWIPQPKGTERVDVLFLEIGDFYSSYAGLQILGLFDGRIRVPLGEVDRFNPFVVSLMTHELAHAMIAAATDDRAPHWLHEGLAQHFEMPQDSAVNPIPGLERLGSRLAFPLVESALAEPAVPDLVQIGYDQARWTGHYLASRYGRQGVRALLAAFRDGATTEEALRRGLGVEPEAFDDALRRWSLEEAPEIWPSEVIDYDPESSGLISRDR